MVRFTCDELVFPQAVTSFLFAFFVFLFKTYKIEDSFTAHFSGYKSLIEVKLTLAFSPCVQRTLKYRKKSVYIETRPSGYKHVQDLARVRGLLIHRKGHETIQKAHLRTRGSDPADTHNVSPMPSSPTVMWIRFFLMILASWLQLISYDHHCATSGYNLISPPLPLFTLYCPLIPFLQTTQPGMLLPPLNPLLLFFLNILVTENIVNYDCYHQELSSSTQQILTRRLLNLEDSKSVFVHYLIGTH